MKPNELAYLLEPFDIRPHNHRTSQASDKVIKGYNQDFEQSVESHLPQTCGKESLSSRW